MVDLYFLMSLIGKSSLLLLCVMPNDITFPVCKLGGKGKMQLTETLQLLRPSHKPTNTAYHHASSSVYDKL